MVVVDRFIPNWHNILKNTEINQGLRIYQTIKNSFRLEPYLYLLREVPFRNAIAQVRATSHTLAIGGGRHTRPKTLIKNIESIDPEFRSMTENEEIYFIFNNGDRRILTWFGKFLHNSFMIRRELLS